MCVCARLSLSLSLSLSLCLSLCLSLYVCVASLLCLSHMLINDSAPCFPGAGHRVHNALEQLVRIRVLDLRGNGGLSLPVVWCEFLRAAGGRVYLDKTTDTSSNSAAGAGELATSDPSLSQQLAALPTNMLRMRLASLFQVRPDPLLSSREDIISQVKSNRWEYSVPVLATTPVSVHVHVSVPQPELYTTATPATCSRHQIFCVAVPLLVCTHFHPHVSVFPAWRGCSFASSTAKKKLGRSATTKGCACQPRSWCLSRKHLMLRSSPLVQRVRERT